MIGLVFGGWLLSDLAHQDNAQDAIKKISSLWGNDAYRQRRRHRLRHWRRHHGLINEGEGGVGQLAVPGTARLQPAPPLTARLAASSLIGVLLLVFWRHDLYSNIHHARAFTDGVLIVRTRLKQHCTRGSWDLRVKRPNVPAIKHIV